jgi:DNA-binding MarR family transcriptional regulator
MPLETAPFDVVEASRRVWLAQWPSEAASGMAVFVGILRSYQLLNHDVNQVMRRQGLTFSRYEVLTWLATDAESSVTLSWISRTLRIPPATVTDIIDRLERDALVRRAPHPSDARTTLAVITPRGRKLANDATRELNAAVYERIGLAEEKRALLIDLLAELRANGAEFDVARSTEVIDELGARHAANAKPAAARARDGQAQRAR